MIPEGKDPIGQAILDFAATGTDRLIVVASDLCEDDTIASAYLFRSYDEMPEIERIALAHCSGSILDVGAAGGVHATWLAAQGKEVSCIDVSPGAVHYLQSRGLDANLMDFFEPASARYDTLLLLMNGLGIAGTLSNFQTFLQVAKAWLNPGGKIVCDSTDIRYLYEDDEGGVWFDLQAAYYGEFQFQMRYENQQTDWFPWLYIDQQTLKSEAEKAGFTCRILAEEESHYLSELKLN